MQRATAAQDSIRGLMGGQNGKIRLSLSHSFGTTQILPAIPKFCDRYQDISFEVDQSTGCITTTGATFDVAFMTGMLRDSSLVARRLFDIQRVLCVSPGYLRHNFALHAPADLQKLRFATLTSETRNSLHLRHTSDERAAEVFCPAAITTHDETSLIALALAGAGVAALDLQLATSALAAGRLIQVMPSWALAPTPVWAVTTTKQIPQRVSLFLDFLSSELQVQKNPFSHAGSVSPITFHKEQDRNAMDHAPARTLASQ
jgi:DNA-binding transcriptional LysR family regulator